MAKDTHSCVSFCRIAVDDDHSCSSANFSTNGTSYQRVCGRARGYQKGTTDGYYGYHQAGQNMNGYFTDGLIITHQSPRQHNIIWTYTAGVYGNRTHPNNCPCSEGGYAAPPFVGNNFYCESGATDSLDTAAYYFDDPLWDGSGCIKNSSRCCDNTIQPWFYRELNKTTSSDIEARLCTHDAFQINSVLIDQLELYVQ